ncbi:NAD-dependent epimerase/dehydratase family protein [Oceanospirillum sediminis]|uniref:NAD-dependent epimerase/dehydratase family protein n=1 Tax=Oceanospirillum sediminis TaxID=2760088 RepID=A0A839IQ06_9GAMM|nr:NAD-dependent epimerase/dehydratase family protein [Oceanospirillum sediminis]MBB1487335.1 NAD-dependent epimerase/dehydratase family protein [Oceanospirillum sediminis]
MAKYLVTGGCGFIGSHLCDALIEQGHDVIVLDNLSTGKTINLNSKAQLFVGNICDSSLVNMLMGQVDGCFHLAAVASVVRSNEAWAETHATNQSGTVSIFEAASQGGKPVVYASSAAVYGDNAVIPLTESSQVRPLTAYGVDKLACELQAQVAGRIHNTPTMGFRFFNVFGERQDASSPYSGVISIFADRILSHKDIIIYGDGSQIRDFVYVKDVVQYLIGGMRQASVRAPVFNVCTGRSSSIKDLANILFSIVGYDVKVTYAARKPGDIQTSLGDPGALVHQFNYQPQYDLYSGLMEMLASEVNVLKDAV